MTSSSHPYAAPPSFTISRRILLGLNVMTFRGAIVISSPVLGFLPTRSFFWAHEEAPKTDDLNPLPFLQCFLKHIQGSFDHLRRLMSRESNLFMHQIDDIRLNHRSSPLFGPPLRACSSIPNATLHSHDTKAPANVPALFFFLFLTGSLGDDAFSKMRGNLFVMRELHRKIATAPGHRP